MGSPSVLDIIVRMNHVIWTQMEQMEMVDILFVMQ